MSFTYEMNCCMSISPYFYLRNVFNFENIKTVFITYMASFMKLIMIL